MRTFFYRLGIFAAVLLLLVVGVFGYLIYAGSGYDRESKQYVDDAVIAITANWDREELIRRASPQLLTNVKAEDLESLFTLFSTLGPLVDYQGSKWSSSATNSSIGQGTTISANYSAQALFKQGDATIRMTVVKSDGAWKIQAFRVDSSVLITNAVGRKS